MESLNCTSIQGGDNVSFTVKVKSTYSTGQNAELELYVDGNLVDSTQGVINANSEKTFNLHWLAHQGEHPYTIKAYSLAGGEKFTEDEREGSLNIIASENQSGVRIMSFTCTPKEVGLSEWGIDDGVSCRIVLFNNGTSSVSLNAWQIIDGHEIKSLGDYEVSRELELEFNVHFNDELARQLYGPEADATFFVESKTVKEGEKCERGVCYSIYKNEFYPKLHEVGFRIYIKPKFLEAQTEIRVEYDNYVVTKYVQWVGFVSVNAILTITDLPIEDRDVAKNLGKYVLDWIKGYLGGL